MKAVICSAVLAASLHGVASAAAFTPSPLLRSAPANHVGLHSMLFPTTPYSAKEEMFAQAKAAGASSIRVDLSLSAIFTRGEYRGHPFYQTNWAATDQYAELSNRYGVRVLADVYATPWFIADCPAGVSREDAYHCPAADLGRYKQMVADVAARYAGVINDFEIINEPDTARAFYGTPVQYARMLSAAADGVHGANPAGRVAIGGVARISDTVFTDAVLDSDASLAAKIDIPTIHLRTSARGTATLVSAWREYYDAHGIRGPLWLTEFGYPAATAFQYDTKFQGGEEAQAQFLASSIPGIIGAGADKFFVTQRDWGSGAFASEGILDAPDPLPDNPVVRRRPAFDVIKRASAGIVPVAVPAPRGTTRLSSRQKGTIKVVRKSVTLIFACPASGACPQDRLLFRYPNGNAHRVITPLLAGGSTASVKVPLTKTGLRQFQRAGKRGLLMRLMTTKGVVISKIRVVG